VPARPMPAAIQLNARRRRSTTVVGAAPHATRDARCPLRCWPARARPHRRRWPARTSAVHRIPGGRAGRLHRHGWADPPGGGGLLRPTARNGPRRKPVLSADLAHGAARHPQCAAHCDGNGEPGWPPRRPRIDRHGGATCGEQAEPKQCNRLVCAARGRWQVAKCGAIPRGW
jgi:hypothetical protein